MDQLEQTSAATVATRVGHLHVETAGSGPPAVLWHSLFVDSTTWNRLRAPLAAERRRVRLLTALYRLAGPGAVIKPLVDALLGPKARAEDPEGAAIVAGAFRRAKRRAMFDAIRWLSLGRPDLTPVLDRLETPTLLTTNADDPMWTIAAAQAAAARLRNGALAILPGSGHIGPLLQAAPDVVALLTAFWRDPWGQEPTDQMRRRGSRPSST